MRRCKELLTSPQYTQACPTTTPNGTVEHRSKQNTDEQSDDLPYMWNQNKTELMAAEGRRRWVGKINKGFKKYKLPAIN